jgi:hypothetical protein
LPFKGFVPESAGIIYGRRVDVVMRYWDDDQPVWDAVERDFAAAWHAKPKWVVSRTRENPSGRMPLLSGTTPERLCASSGVASRTSPVLGRRFASSARHPSVRTQ